MQSQYLRHCMDTNTGVEQLLEQTRDVSETEDPDFGPTLSNRRETERIGDLHSKLLNSLCEG